MPYDDLFQSMNPETEELEIVPNIEKSMAPTDSGFSENLVQYIDDTELKTIGMELDSKVQGDEACRADFMQTYREAIEILAPDGGVNDESMSDSDKRLERVRQTSIDRGMAHFIPRAMRQMMPNGGPVKVRCNKDTPKEVREQIEIIEKYYNFNLTKHIDGYRDTLETMLNYLALVGGAFLHIRWDEVKNRISIELVPYEDLIISPESKTIKSSARYTYIQRMDRREFERLVSQGFYEELNSPMTGRSPNYNHTSDGTESSGIKEPSKDEDLTTIVLKNVFVNYKFESFDDNYGDDMALPYCITIEDKSNQVVSIRRNWTEDDEYFCANQHFVGFKYLPSLNNIYGRGLYHSIGGINQALQSVTQLLLEQGALVTSMTGFSREGVEGGDEKIKPNEIRKVPGVGAISDEIMPIQFAEPSATLFSMLGFLKEEADEFNMISDMNIADLQKSDNLPVGTVTALIEQSTIEFTGIHERLHNSQTEVFDIMKRLFYENMPEVEEFVLDGTTMFISREFFNHRFNVIPVSDTSVSSSTQRIGKAMELANLWQMFPDLIDSATPARYILEALEINPDDVLKIPEMAKPMNPVDENTKALLGGGIQAFSGQDHRAHAAVHRAFQMRPDLQTTEQGIMTIQALDAHIMEHMALEYEERNYATLNRQPTPEEKEDPNVQNELAREFAILHTEREYPPIQPLLEGGDEAVNAATRLAEVESMIRMGEANEKILAERAKLANQLEIDRIKAEYKSEQEFQSNAMKVLQMRDQHQAELADKDEKHLLELQHMEEKHAVEMGEALDKQRIEMQTKINEATARAAENEEKLNALRQRNLIERVRNSDE